jgi:hypothetical protein
MDKKLENKLAEFDQAESLLIELGEAIWKSDEGRIFGVDLLVIAALRRALAVLHGFKILIENRNFVSAAALLRLQLDSSLRLFAGTLVDDPHRLALEVISGKRIDQMVDRDGKRMTDSYLVKKLTKLYPWIRNVYKQTSGYIHLSAKHFHAAVHEVGEDRHVAFQMAAQDSDLFPPRLYLEATEAFLAATRVFAELLGSWFAAKDEAGNERLKHQKHLTEEGA